MKGVAFQVCVSLLCFEGFMFQVCVSLLCFTSGKAAFSHQHVRYHWDSHGSPRAIMASKLVGSPQDKVSDNIQC
jgi:hypothetical protein